MDVTFLIQNYAEYFLKPTVTNNLARESWFGTDADGQYVNYVKDYLTFRKLIEEGRLKEENLEAGLKKVLKARSESLFIRLREDLIDRIRMERTVETDEILRIQDALKAHLTDTGMDVEITKQMRQIAEEEIGG